MTVRALIVDDEAVARRGLRQHLQSESDIEVIGESEDGASAIEAIAELKPDLVFLDLQMPGLGGFDVIESVGLARMPAVIFVTAYDQFSLRAFDVHAIDYILKPIDPVRFATAIERARLRLRSMDPLGERIAAALKDLDRAPPSAWSKRLAIRNAGRVIVIEARDIDRCESDGNYVDVHVGAKVHVMRETLAALESRLDPNQFVRISRSSLINIERVRELHPTPSGDFVAVMADGSRVPGSRRYREALDALLR